MEKSKPIILLAVAVIFALVTSFLIYNWLQKRGKEKETLISKTMQVVVAANDLSAGTKLTEQTIPTMTKTVPFLQENLPRGFFSDSSSLKERVLILPLKVNEPILESKLAPISVTTGGVAAIIDPKKRAMAIRVDKIIGVAGFILPGNRVDVLVTISQGETTITKTVLNNMLVLATGTELEKKEKEEKPSLVDVITMEVTPVEGEKLALAASQGRLALALRNFTDTEPVMTRGETVSSLLTLYQPVKKTVAVSRAEKKVTQPVKKESVKEGVKVEMIKASEVKELTF
ncbi:MAG: Flp pilus assembly protein CpaB [Syntrophobacterales bacterium CG_4_8_14_3_um_filter_49_14]|nr:MAG: Flp pilus assembly protein CpaB [Syntrophobacterales bacterium CG_4_8_14_3_um_filter_49_14]